MGPTGAAPAGTQSRQVWVQGDTAMRWLEDGGNEEVYARGRGHHAPLPGRQAAHARRTMQMVPNEIFRVGGLLERAKDVGLEETDDAYVLRWREKSGRRTGPRSR